MCHWKRCYFINIVYFLARNLIVNGMKSPVQWFIQIVILLLIFLLVFLDKADFVLVFLATSKILNQLHIYSICLSQTYHIVAICRPHFDHIFLVVIAILFIWLVFDKVGRGVGRVYILHIMTRIITDFKV